MRQYDIPLDKAELLAVLLEAILFGFSLLMFGATIWTLVFRRSTNHVNLKMIIAACLLLLGSSAHIILSFVRVIEGLILYRDTYSGGPIAYFADVSQWTFVSKCCLFTVQTMIGDSVVLYRCYSVWQSKFVMILPVLLWCVTTVTGIVIPYTASRGTQGEIFSGPLSRWIMAFWATAFATNLLATTMLVGRIWYVDRRAARHCSFQQSHLRPILHALIDAGAIYSLTLFVELICFTTGSNGQYVLLAVVMPIISITFYMVIIQVGLTTRANHSTNIQLGGSTSRDHAMNVERRHRTQVYITKMTETEVYNPVPLRSLSTVDDEDTLNKTKSAGVREISMIL